MCYRVVLLFSIFFLLRSFADGQEAAKAPFRLDEIIDFHKSDVPCRRLSILIGERGVSFPATPDVIKRLKSAGVCDSAIQTVENVAPTLPTGIATGELIEKGNSYLDQGQYAEASEQFKKAKDSALLAKTERAAAYEKSIAGSDRFPLESIDGLLANLTPKRVSTLVTEKGILCVPSETYMQRLERSKVDDRVIVAIEKKGLDNGRQIRKLQDAASSALDQGKYAEAIENIEKAISVCPSSKVIIATRDRARSAQSADASAKTTPMDLPEIERLLRGSVTPKRLVSLAKQRNISFKTFSPDDERKLREAGANDEVIYAIKEKIPAAPGLASCSPPSEAVRLVNAGKTAASSQQSKFDEALQLSERALAISACYKDAWELKGDALRQLKRYQEAIGSYDTALKFDNLNAFVWAKKALALMELSRFEDAVQSFQRALDINPTSATLWAFKGNTLLALKRCEEARESYDKAIGIDPSLNIKLHEKLEQLKDCRA